jgi:hypothetical protein
MIWVGLAMLVMLASGDGNNVRAFMAWQEKLVSHVDEIVDDPIRREAAAAVLDDALEELLRMRRIQSEFGDCVEALDRTYEVSAADYEVCFEDRYGYWAFLIDTHERLKAGFRSHFTDPEWAELERRIGRDTRFR